MPVPRITHPTTTRELNQLVAGTVSESNCTFTTRLAIRHVKNMLGPGLTSIGKNTALIASYAQYALNETN